jgi:hypothetical protein
VDAPRILYHGTPWPNLGAVLAAGLVPRREAKGFVSPHQTKTTDATFLTDEREAALGYAVAGGHPGAVLEIDTRGLPLEPDYDDAGLTIDVDGTELWRELQSAGIDLDVSPGIPIPEDLVEAVEDVIEGLKEYGMDEREEPFAFSVEYAEDGTAFLAADPVVPFFVDASLAREYPELYDWNDLGWGSERGPYLYQRQYLCRCSIPVSSILGVWVPVEAAPGASGERQVLTDYTHIERPEDAEGDPIDVRVLEDEGREDEIDFRKVAMVKLTVPEARAMLGGTMEHLPAWVRADPDTPSIEGMQRVATYQDGEVAAYYRPGTMPGDPGTPAAVVVALDVESGHPLVPWTYLPAREYDAVRQWLSAKLGPEDTMERLHTTNEAALRSEILRAAKGVCAAHSYLNCRLFAQLTSGVPDLESIPPVTGAPGPRWGLPVLRVGDVLQWGENPARHWAIYMGSGEALEVPEWGGDLALTRVSAISDEYDGPVIARRPPWGSMTEITESLRVRRIEPGDARDEPRENTYMDPEWQARATLANTTLRSQGIILHSYLGCGSYGCAFRQQPMVVKLTEDAAEAANAKTVMQHGGCPGVARIYGVFAFDRVPDMYAILMEPLEPLTDKERHFIWNPLDKKGDTPRRIDSAMWERRNSLIGDRTYKTFIRDVRAAAKEKLGKKGAEAIESLIEATECLYDLGIHYVDGHHENVMARWVPQPPTKTGKESPPKRELVYMDLGHSLGPPSQVPVMERAP